MNIGFFCPEVLCVSFISHWIIRLFYAEIRHKIVKFGMVFYYYVWFWFSSSALSLTCVCLRKKKANDNRILFLFHQTYILADVLEQQSATKCCAPMTIATKQRMTEKKSMHGEQSVIREKTNKPTANQTNSILKFKSVESKRIFIARAMYWISW